MGSGLSAPSNSCSRTEIGFEAAASGLGTTETIQRVGPTAAHMASRTSADSILCIVNRFWDLMPLRRNQKLLPHFDEAGTAVFAVEEVEYGGHDPTSLCSAQTKTTRSAALRATIF